MTLTADEKPQFDADLSVYLPLQGSFRDLSAPKGGISLGNRRVQGMSKMCLRSKQKACDPFGVIYSEHKALIYSEL